MIPYNRAEIRRCFAQRRSNAFLNDHRRKARVKWRRSTRCRCWPRAMRSCRTTSRQLKLERPSIIDAIEEARAHGDLSENAEYHAAKERQGQVEAMIADIDDRLSRAMVIDPKTPQRRQGRVRRHRPSDRRERQQDQISDRRRDRGGRQDRADQLRLAARPRADRPLGRRGGRILGAVGRQILRDQEDPVRLMRRSRPPERLSMRLPDNWSKARVTVALVASSPRPPG